MVGLQEGLQDLTFCDPAIRQSCNSIVSQGGSMTLLNAAFAALLAAAAAEMPAVVVQAPDSPVKIGRATVLTVAGDPPVLLYAATNQTSDELDQFTVMVFVFDAKGALKARQVAPGRRTLEAKSTKYSTIVLDGGPVGPGDSVVIGVNQAQRRETDPWWRADLQPAAEAAVPRKP
jgi:hypothetical protein